MLSIKLHEKAWLILCFVAVLGCRPSAEIVEHRVPCSSRTNMGSAVLNTEAASGASVFVASKDLSPRTVVTTDCIETEVLAKRELPADTLASEAELIGRLLRVQVVKGQVLTKGSFFPKGPSGQPVAKIPPGLISFTMDLRMDIPRRAVLRPGSIVDIVSITKPPTNRRGQTITIPVLKGISLLDVQGEVIPFDPNTGKSATASYYPGKRGIVISDPNMGDSAIGTRGSTQGVLIALLVDPLQAAALELVLHHSSLALVIHDPWRNLPSEKLIIATRLTRPFRYRYTLDGPAIEGTAAWESEPYSYHSPPGKTELP